MKIGFIVSTMVAICLAIVVVMGMGHFSDLKKEVADLKKEQPAKSAGSSTRTGTGSRTGRLQSSSSRASGPSKSERAVVENDDPGEEGREEWEENPQKMMTTLRPTTHDSIDDELEEEVDESEDESLSLEEGSGSAN